MLGRPSRALPWLPLCMVLLQAVLPGFRWFCFAHIYIIPPQMDKIRCTGWASLPSRTRTKMFVP